MSKRTQYEKQRDRAFWIAAVMVSLYLAGVITALQIPPQLKIRQHHYDFDNPKLKPKQWPGSTIMPWGLDPNGNPITTPKGECVEFPPLNIFCV